MFVDSTSTDLIGIGVMVALAFLGFAVGQAADTKSELEDLIR
jgi:F0F1-type ATP synthase membrane subunit c/vacuolar-type H+-ATPase subunit K